MRGFIGLAAVLLFTLPAAAQRPGTDDHLEPGLQGQATPEDLKTEILPRPYSKGVRPLGHTDIGGGRTNVMLSWVDRCAYVSSSRPIGEISSGSTTPSTPGKNSGVAVIDVSNPRRPTTVRLLRDKGSIEAAETMHAVSARDRKVLVAGAYGGGPDASWLDIYDASDCKNPKLMAEYKWPENVHVVTVSPNGKRVYGTSINAFAGAGGILVLDISDMAKPRYLGKFGVTRPDGSSYEFATHEVAVSADERRIYAGVVGSKGGDLNPDLATLPQFDARRLGPDVGGIYILDNSDIAKGRPNPKMRLIGTALSGGWQSVTLAKIRGVPFVIGGGELGACPGAWPVLNNIANEAKPVRVAAFKLQMNLKENCPAPGAVEINSRGMIGGPGTAASNSVDVDSITDTHIGLFPFNYGGLRIADLRDPTNPVEVAYYKPGDMCGSHTRYIRETGQIWFACMASGLHVIELAPELRKKLGLPTASAR